MNTKLPRHVTFSLANTEGYTEAELDVLNTELAARLNGVDPNNREYEQIAKSFADEVSRC